MVAVVVSGGVVEARGGEWYSGSNRSCDEEKIGTGSEKLAEKDGKSQKNESEVVHGVFNSRESDVDDSLVNDRFKIAWKTHINEVFAPVARIEAIRLFLAYASFMGFIVYQMDVKSVFLYGTIGEEVYVCQPPGFEDPNFPDKVYKVEKDLYGLHQALRAWYDTLSTYLIENGFRRGTIDKTLFIMKDKDDILLVQVYVDDIIFGSTKKSLCDEFEGLMHKRFQMSSIGELTFFLGLKVQQKEDGIFISQDKYVAEILKKFNFATVKTASTPMEPNKVLVKDEEADSVDVHLYRSMIGSLMYLTASRPDIMFAVCACARFQVTPKTSHLHAVKRIFRYLKGQPKLGLWYPRDSPFDLEAFSDSDYAGASLDRKSTTGGCQILRQMLISWQCKRQTIVANSTTEAEYVAAANYHGHVLWIQNQMLDYGFNFMNTEIYIDNESTICVVKNPVFHSKTKHIEIRYYFIRDSYEKRLIQVLFGLKLEGKYDDQLLNTVGFSFHYLKKLCTAGLLYAAWQKLVLSSIELVLPGKLSTAGKPLEEVLLGFWNTACLKTINSEKQIHANVDGKPVVVSESSVRIDLHLNDEDEVLSHVTTAATSQPPKDPSTYKRTKRGQNTKVPQSGGSPNKVGDEAINEEMLDSVERAATTATSLEWSLAPRNHGGMQAQTRSEGVSNLSSDPPLSGGHTLGSGEDSMEHQIELTDNVPNTPHDLPLPGGYTPGSNEGRLKLEELMAMCTKLSKHVLNLEKEKDAQAMEILKLKKRVKKLERQRKSSISHSRRRIYRQVKSSDDDLDEKDASKQGRTSDKTKPMFKDSNFDDLDDLVDEGMDFVQEKDGVSTASVPETVSTAAPRTPSTATTVFDDEDVTMAMAQTLIKMKEEKAKEKGVVIKDVEDSSRPIRLITTLQPLPTIDPKDKCKGILQETEHVEKTKKKVQGDAKIEKDAEVALRL
ncbi:putative ribonuclease H-like domain-containing protein [Tanacetum coccineum]